MFRPGPSRTLTLSPRASTPQRLTHLAGQVGVPRGRERGGCREAGGFFGVGDAEVVGVAELAAYAVGAVAHDEGGDVCCGDGA